MRGACILPSTQRRLRTRSIFCAQPPPTAPRTERACQARRACVRACVRRVRRPWSRDSDAWVYQQRVPCAALPREQRARLVQREVRVQVHRCEPRYALCEARDLGRDA